MIHPLPLHAEILVSVVSKEVRTAIKGIHSRIQPQEDNFKTLRGILSVKKGKAFPLQARSGPEGSRKLRCTDFMTTAPDGGKVVSLTHRRPRKYTWYSFVLEAESTPGP